MGGGISLCLQVGMTLLYCQTDDEIFSLAAGGVTDNEKLLHIIGASQILMILSCTQTRKSPLDGSLNSSSLSYSI